MKLKKLMIAGITLLSVLALASCGNKDNSASKEKSNKITIMLDSEPGKDDPVINALDTWKEETGNDYETLIVGYDDQLQKFPLMIKNNDLPDIVITTRLHKEYPEDFVDLSKAVDIKNFDADVLEVGLGNRSEGIQILPTQITITNYYYNKEAFEKAGIEAPTVDTPWTLEELYSNAQKLVDSGAVKYGFAVDYSRARYDNLMYSNGGSLTELDGENPIVTLNSKENIDTLQTFIDANNDGVAPKNIWAGGSTDNPMNYFQNGDVGIYLSGSFNYANISKDSKVEFGVMTAPKGLKQQSELNGGRGFGVLKDSDNSDLAVDFVKWFYGSEKNYQEFLDRDFGLPFMTNYSYEPTSTFAKDDYDVYVNELTKVPSEFITDEASQWGLYLEDEYRQSISKAVSGEITAKEALDSVAEKISKNAKWEMKYKP